jgi:hypothetical protein
VLCQELCGHARLGEWFRWVLDYKGWTLASVFGDNPVQLGLKLDIYLYFDNNQLASPIVEYV